jgi:hypothetical protein
VQIGTIAAVGPNHLTVARYRIPVLVIRLLGLLALAFAGVLAVFHGRMLHRGSQRPLEEQIAAHFGLLVAPVETRVLPAGLAPTPMHDFMGLATLARYLERPILRQTDESGSVYTVDDQTRVYEYRAPPAAQAPAVAPLPAPTVVRSGRSRRTSWLVIGGALLTVIVAITLVTSFTASTTVPASSAGTTTEARTVSQLTPAGCASLGLTSIAIHSGSFTNNATHALILGDASTETITDNGSHNCIVGGGGRDTVHAVASDVCIVGPTTGATYDSCTKSA